VIVSPREGTSKLGVWIVTAAVLGLAWSCGEEAVEPVPESGAGIAVRLPEAWRNADWLRVELWHDDPIEEPPHCDPGALEMGPVPGARGAAAQPDTCSRISVKIWDYAGDPVRDEPDVRWSGQAWGWDQLDDGELPVTSGMYFTFQNCLDSRGTFYFQGSYFVIRDREKTRCEWPLWIEELEPGPDGPEVRFGGFPESSARLKLNLFDVPDTVYFQNPFTVRVHAPGLPVHEQEIVLREGAFADVRVAAAP